MSNTVFLQPSEPRVLTLKKNDPVTLRIVELKAEGLSYRAIQEALKKEGTELSRMAIRNRYIKFTSESDPGTIKPGKQELSFEENDGGRKAFLVKSDCYERKVNVGDCGTRAIAQLLNKAYVTVYNYIERQGVNPTKGTPHRVFEPYLEAHNYSKIDVRPWHKSLTLKKLYEYCPRLFSMGAMFECKRHVYFVNKGVIQDTWDASKKAVLSIWVPSNERVNVMRDIFTNYRSKTEHYLHYKTLCLSAELKQSLSELDYELEAGWGRDTNSVKYKTIKGAAQKLIESKKWASDLDWWSVVGHAALYEFTGARHEPFIVK